MKCLLASHPAFDAHALELINVKTHGEWLPLWNMPDETVVYMIRDVRDCIASFRKTPWHNEETSATFISELWADYLMEARSLKFKKYAEVQYEKLVSAPQTELTTLCEKLGVAADPELVQQMQRFTDRMPAWKPKIVVAEMDSGEPLTEIQKEATLCGLNNRINGGSVGRHIRELSDEDLSSLHQAALPLMKGLGYL